MEIYWGVSLAVAIISTLVYWKKNRVKVFFFALFLSYPIIIFTCIGLGGVIMDWMAKKFKIDWYRIREK